MCRAYTQRVPPEALAKIFKLEQRPTLNLPPRYNIAPTQAVPIVRMTGGGRALVQARWGLVPGWAKDLKQFRALINARDDQLASSRLWAESFERRRCLVPFDEFYEWDAGKQPWAIVPTEAAPLFAFAGLWSRWQGPEGALDSFTLCTTAPNTVVQPIKDRMPVILGEEAWESWLTGETAAAQALLRPCPPAWLRSYRVSKRVGKWQNDDPGLLEPLPATG